MNVWHWLSLLLYLIQNDLCYLRLNYSYAWSRQTISIAVGRQLTSALLDLIAECRQNQQLLSQEKNSVYLFEKCLPSCGDYLMQARHSTLYHIETAHCGCKHSTLHSWPQNPDRKNILELRFLLVWFMQSDWLCWDIIPMLYHKSNDPRVLFPGRGKHCTRKEQCILYGYSRSG